MSNLYTLAEEVKTHARQINAIGVHIRDGTNYYDSPVEALSMESFGQLLYVVQELAVVTEMIAQTVVILADKERKRMDSD